jgi:hypothetical protein
MFIPESPFEADVTVCSLTDEAKLEEFLVLAVIPQEIHKDLEVNLRFKEF